MRDHSRTRLVSGTRTAWPRWARCALAAGALLTSAVVHAALPVQQLTVAFTNAFPKGSVDTLTMPNNAAAIAATNPLLLNGTSQNLYTALAWVTNSATNTLDLIYADAEQHKIWRLPGPGYTNPVAIFSWSSKVVGPPFPIGLAADGSGNVYVISPACVWGNSGVWVLPFDASATTYYDPPRLIDNTFTDPATHKPVPTVALTEVLLAGSAASGAMPAWSAGDLLVLVADLYDTRVIHYTQAQIQSVLDASPPLSKGLAGPNSTVVTAAQFSTQAIKKVPPVPVGMDIGQNPTTPGDATLLLSTANGSILEFDSAANGFTATPYATNLGLGLTRLKVGTFQATQYVFVGQLPGRILEFQNPQSVVPPVSSNTLATAVASVTTGVNNPSGLAATNSGSVPASSCVPGSFTGSIAGSVLTVSAPSGAPIAVGQTIAGAGVPVGTTITSFGSGTGGAGTYNLSTTAAASVGPEAMTNVGCAITPQFSLAITGQSATVCAPGQAPPGCIPANATIAADSCTFIDTRVPSPGVCPVATTLDLADVCSNMPHVTLPTTICGAWGVSGASISATKVSASTVDQNINNTLTTFALNPNSVLAGTSNPNCGSPNGPIAVWGPLPPNESPIPEGTLIDITVACTPDPPPGGKGSHPSIVLQGTVNAPLTSGYIDGEFGNLQTAFTDISTGPPLTPPPPATPPAAPPAMQINDPTGKVVPTIQGYISNSLSYFNGQNYNCALNTLWQGTQYVYALANNQLPNMPNTSADFIAGSPPFDQNPSGTVLMRLDHLYYDVYIFAGIVTTGMSPPPLTTDALNLTVAQVPTCSALNQPSGLAISPNGDLYVANYGTGQVLVYAPGTNGQMVQQPSLTLSSGLVNPVRLALSTGDNSLYGFLFVADTGANTVTMFDANGNAQLTIGGLTRPLGVAVDSRGVLYVAENYGGPPAVEDIRVYSITVSYGPPPNYTPSYTPTLLYTYTQDYSGVLFQTVGALAYSTSASDVLVGLPSMITFYSTTVEPVGSMVNPSNCSVSGAVLPCPQQDPNQTPLTNTGDNTYLDGVTGIAVDGSGNVDVTNYYSGQNGPAPGFEQFYSYPSENAGSPTGLTLTGSGPALSNPQGVAVDSSGNIYLANSGNNTIDVYNSSGIYQYSIH
jgi:hypothetical protein